MINKPHWEKQHDWWMADFVHILECICQLKEMLMRHPDDAIGEILRSMLRDTEKWLKREKNRYKRIYGSFPKLKDLKDAIEKD